MIIRPGQELGTTFWLPPGALPPGRARKMLHLALVKHAWFKPRKIGEGRDAIALKDDGAGAIQALVASYKKDSSRLLVSGRAWPDSLFLLPNRFGKLSYTGSIAWWTHVRSARKPGWKESHADQVVELMRMLNSPLVTTCTEEDHDTKMYRHDPSPTGGTVRRVTTMGYHEGLVGLFWRNFFGPPLVDFFGDKLRTLPPDRARDLGGIWLVEPYDFPDQAGTDEARARERELIQHLGPECFYDQERDVKATRVIDLPPLADGSRQVAQDAVSRGKAVKKKLGEYWTWAKQRWKEEGAIVRTTREGCLLLSTGSSSLARAVLDWGLSHTDDPLFLERTPDQVAMYLEAKGEVPGRGIHPDARAELARIRTTLGDAGFDALIGLLPAVRDVETALKKMAPGSREAQEMLPRFKVVRKLGKLLTFVPKPVR